MRAIEFTVNERKVSLDVDESTPLVLALRNDLGLRGVRAGCAIGECGVCVVLVDGRASRSCQVPLSAVAGASVTTPEGLGTPAAPHAVQQAFLDEQAAQCGYCVNGIIMSIVDLLERGSAPDEASIRSALAGHLCRCGAQHRILQAIRRLAGHHLPAPAQQITRAGDGDETSPSVLHASPNVEQWLRPLPDGRIEVRSGRVELGQGLRTALAQIVATELDIPVDRVVVRSVATDASPDEGYTSASASLDVGGAAVARAAAAFRRLREAGQPPVGPITVDDRPRWSGRPLGEPVPRTDLAEKVTGAPAYLHDMVLPGMVHARALLPPTYEARPVALDVAGARAMPGVVAVVHDGGLIVVIAEREEQAARGVDLLARTAQWNDPGLIAPHDAPVESIALAESAEVEAALASGRRFSAMYAKSHEAHGSMAPSCAVALAEPDHLTLWTHNQGVFPLRRELAALLGVDESRMTVRHVDGPGCYGHNGADDAAAFAAIAARAVPGRPVRFQYSVHDEFRWEPYGPAMRAELDASLDRIGRITAWRSRVRTGPHASRPHGSGDRLVAAWLRTGGPKRPWPGALGGAFNAMPIYALPAADVTVEYVKSPLRTSTLRSLGAYFNVFAVESFMDELAAAAGQNPVAFRLAHLHDERARTVLELAAERANWQPGRGQGVAVARFKGTKAYVAQIVDARTHQGVATVERILTVCDAGVVVNPDGLRNQLEGGTLQGLSRALHERVRFGPHGIESRDWTEYPVLRFAEVPHLETVLVDRPGLPPLGVGEAATAVTAAAVANAFASATGIRVRTLPIRPG